MTSLLRLLLLAVYCAVLTYAAAPQQHALNPVQVSDRSLVSNQADGDDEEKAGAGDEEGDEDEEAVVEVEGGGEAAGGAEEDDDENGTEEEGESDEDEESDEEEDEESDEEEDEESDEVEDEESDEEEDEESDEEDDKGSDEEPEEAADEEGEGEEANEESSEDGDDEDEEAKKKYFVPHIQDGVQGPPEEPKPEPEPQCCCGCCENVPTPCPEPKKEFVTPHFYEAGMRSANNYDLLQDAAEEDAARAAASAEKARKLGKTSGFKQVDVNEFKEKFSVEPELYDTRSEPGEVTVSSFVESLSRRKN